MNTRYKSQSSVILGDSDSDSIESADCECGITNYYLCVDCENTTCKECCDKLHKSTDCTFKVITLKTFQKQINRTINEIYAQLSNIESQYEELVKFVEPLLDYFGGDLSFEYKEKIAKYHEETSLIRTSVKKLHKADLDSVSELLWCVLQIDKLSENVTELEETLKQEMREELRLFVDKKQEANKPVELPRESINECSNHHIVDNAPKLKQRKLLKTTCPHILLNLAGTNSTIQHGYPIVEDHKLTKRLNIFTTSDYVSAFCIDLETHEIMETSPTYPDTDETLKIVMGMGQGVINNDIKFALTKCGDTSAKAVDAITKKPLEELPFWSNNLWDEQHPVIKYGDYFITISDFEVIKTCYVHQEEKE